MTEQKKMAKIVYEALDEKKGYGMGQRMRRIGTRHVKTASGYVSEMPLF